MIVRIISLQHYKIIFTIFNLEHQGSQGSLPCYVYERAWMTGDCIGFNKSE